MTHFLFGFHLQKVSKTNPKIEDEQESDINSDPCIMTHFLLGFHLQKVSQTTPKTEDEQENDVNSESQTNEPFVKDRKWLTNWHLRRSFEESPVGASL